MPKIDLNNDDLRKILVEKYGEAEFRIVYTEPQQLWADRNKIDLSAVKSLEGLPKRFSCIVYI